MESQEKEPLNKLEQKIFDELDRFEKLSQYITKQDAARIASRIVLEVAEKAHGRGYWLGEHNDDGIEGWEDFEDFKKEIL
jgi:hypothetical protein